MMHRELSIYVSLCISNYTKYLSH